ncbi:MAG: DUF4115 domain-containing protein [Proteobacteria bacterium]|nr:DUF4115 domain-containing protein [Pseudomonadota bacterium]
MAPGGGAAAPRVGADLAVARERLGRTVPEMSHLLRIRLPYLEALEQGRIDALPGRAYALAFLRTYATALGLDADEAVRRFKTEAAEIGDRTELEFPAPLPERGLPTGALVLLGLVLAVGAYAGWYRLSGEGRLPAETVMPVPARLARLTAPAARAPAAPAGGGAGTSTAQTGGTAPGGGMTTSSGMTAQAAGGSGGPGTPAHGAASGGPAVAALVPPTGPGASGSPIGPLADTLPTSPMPDVASGSAAAATPTPAQDAAMLADGPGGSGLLVLATANAWVQVRSGSGAVVFSHLLHAGQSWPVPAGQNLVLTTGNAGGTVLVRHGVASAPLGGNGVVLHNVALGPTTGTSAAGPGAPAAGTPQVSAPAGAAPGAGTAPAGSGTAH